MGRQVEQARGPGPASSRRRTPRAYGEWLGKRYKDKPIIWILGGDRPVENDAHTRDPPGDGRGLREGDGGSHLITFHPPGGNGSSTWFHDEDWLDFNMRQNGHVAEFTGRYDKTRADYDRTDPVKPVIDGEPIYEDHPVSFKAKELGHSIAADVRRPLYWDLFSGACGHTYGHHCVWQMYAPGRNADQRPADALVTRRSTSPAPRRCSTAGALIESRPFLTRVPDDSIIVTDARADQRPRRRHAPLRRHARRATGPTRSSTRRWAGRSACEWTTSRGRR